MIKSNSLAILKIKNSIIEKVNISPIDQSMRMDISDLKNKNIDIENIVNTENSDDGQINGLFTDQNQNNIYQIKKDVQKTL